MRFVFIADPLDVQSAGIHTYARGILKAIDALNTEHEIYIIRAKSSNDYENSHEISIPIKKNFPLHQRIRTFYSIPNAINKLNPDAVIEMAHFGPFNIKRSAKRVTVIHDLTPILFPKFHPFSSVLFHKLLLKRVLKNADHIITNSKNSKYDICKAYPFAHDKVTPIPLGVDQVDSRSKEDDSSHSFKEDERPYFLNVGTIEPRKNLELLINAFNKFKVNDDSKTELIIVGKKGWKYQSIEKALLNSPYNEYIIVKGYVNKAELNTLYSRAKAFIYPSYYEGFGLPLLEAMQHGVPVLSSDSSSLPEVGGDIALYFSSSEELSSLMNKCITLSDSERIDLKRRGKNHASKFAWEKTAEKTIQLLVKIVNLGG